MSSHLTITQVYKIVPKHAWAFQLNQAPKFGYFGSELDLKDGFIHMSRKEQVKETLTKHFRRQTDLLLLAVNLKTIKPPAFVKWELSRNNELFPHLYNGVLTLSSVDWIAEIIWSEERNEFILPKELDL
jgi:uncharacterized protein (DUF952 family)